MKLEWLEDLIAVLDSESLNEASKKRFLTQPAFSRRIQSIEQYVGAKLLDRNRKPVQLKSAVLNNEARIRQLAQSLRELKQALRSEEQHESVLVLGCQHSISTAVAPALVKALSGQTNSRIRIRSANRDQCHALMLEGHADIILTYQAESEIQDTAGEFVETRVIGKDAFIPVAAKGELINKNALSPGQEIHLVGYPENVFLGRVFNREITPRIGERYDIRWIAETGLTPAALQFALTGVGIAWVPRSLAMDMMKHGRLIDISHTLPAVSLEICAMRLKRDTRTTVDEVWDWLMSPGLLPDNE